MKLTERLLEANLEQCKEVVMSNIQQGFIRTYLGRSFLILSAAAVAVSAPSTLANTKPTEVPARVIAHMSLPEASGSEMLLQTKGDKRYLYVQKASKQGFTVIDVTKPQNPALVGRTAPSNDATAGNLELVGPNVGLAEVPDKSSKGLIRSADQPTETVKVLDLSDPAHPKVLQTFNGVTSILLDSAHGLIYLTNNEGLWILIHSREGLIPAKKLPPCKSEDAIQAMPPDCE